MSYIVGCACPATDLIDIADDNCSSNFWYTVERLIFQRESALPITKANAALGATWAALFTLAATDPEKAVITPRYRLTITPTAGEFVEVTAANAREVSQIIDLRETVWNGTFTNLTPDQKTQLDALACFKDLKVWLVNKQNQIIGQEVSPTTVTGFSIFPDTFGLNTLAQGDGQAGTFIANNAFKMTFVNKLWDRSAEYITTNFATTIIQ